MTYVRTEETLALNLARSKRFGDVDLASFRRLARHLRLDSERRLDDTVREAVANLQSSWPELRRHMPAAEPVKQAIDRRLRDLPLMRH